MPKWLAGTVRMRINFEDGYKMSIAFGYSLTTFLFGLYLDDEMSDFRIYIGFFHLQVLGEGR